MLEIKSTKGKVSIPNQWEDLTPAQYLQVINLIYSYPLTDTGALSMGEFRLLLLELLSGYKRSRKKYSPEDQEDINNMLSILSEKLTFVYKPWYKDQEIFNVMSEETAEALQNQFPYDLMGTDHEEEILRLIDMIKFIPVLNYNMKSNPLPELKIKRRFLAPKKLKGPVFNIDKYGSGVTNITAGEYVDAQDYYNMFNQTNDVKYLLNLLQVFYRDYSGPYDATKSALMDLSQYEGFALGFFHFFQNIQEYFHTHPVYELLYLKSSSNSNPKISLGQSESLYNASAKGYGDIEKVKQMNLVDYMNTLIKDIKDGVSKMRAYKIKDFQIAKDLELPLSVIKKL